MLALLIAAASRIPLSYILKRSLIIIPFVVLVGIFIPFLKSGEVAGSYNFGAFRLGVTYAGILILWNIFIKAWLSALILIIMSSSTPFHMSLKGLQALRVPFIFIMILSLMYRYLFIIQEKVNLMNIARKLRSPGRLNLKILGNMIAVLFIKSYGKGEQVYTSMCLRGFDGNIKTLDKLKIRQVDFLYLFLSVSFLIIIRFLIG